MPPTSNFGQDITNTAANDNNNGGGNDPNGNGLPNIERMGGKMMISRLAGKGVIRVVRRCEDAKENDKLGNVQFQKHFKFISRSSTKMEAVNEKLFLIKKSD